jgi:hypothetical protein
MPSDILEREEDKFLYKPRDDAGNSTADAIGHENVSGGTLLVSHDFTSSKLVE